MAYVTCVTAVIATTVTYHLFGNTEVLHNATKG